VSTDIAINAEPIPGYAMTERIGAGGYGEVWKASAPGGLTKAVKLVHGHLQDQWAACELRSLRRIKEVRHPFLLSLERIEVVEGRLVIVTELADGSLKDRFEECRASGLPGIPRDELLGYLSDAAEALDYMRAKFSLQHLDVKPENLLVVGGRVKVGDFGLVRDIMDPHWETEALLRSQQSSPPIAPRCSAAPALGGLTPLYAAPEVFDGQPSVHSDQYSLAIVYQELLTGVLPFPGQTAEQLASQHRTNHPRLAPLPAVDRPILERALAKDPRQRFGSCGELITALRVSAHAAAPAAPATELPAPSPGHCDTNAIGLCVIPTEAGSTLPPAMTIGHAAKPCADDIAALPDHLAVADLPPPTISGRAGLRPTLWLGIGGTAARILLHLRQQLSDRFGAGVELPALQMLLVDTDPEAVARAVRGDKAPALGVRETMLTALRKSQEYRERSEEYLRWLSRRWLYNVPFSGRTEGFRPLGRLAFVDHADEISRRLRNVLESITQPGSVAATAQATGLEIRDQTPRVFLIASISGGTGSGMVFDMAYAVRKAMERLGLPEDGLCGVLTHSTARAPERKALAIADAYAWLREWKHWLTTKYECEAAGHRASGGGNSPPLAQAYLVHLGDDLSEREFDRSAEDVAAYLYLDAVTAGGEFLDKCRRSPAADGVPNHAMAQLRTFGVCYARSLDGQAVDEDMDLICQDLLGGWRPDVEEAELAEEAESRPGGPGSAAARAEPEASLDEPGAIARLRSVVLERLPSRAYAAEADQDEPNNESLLAACFELATPRLLTCGGAKRLLLAMPGTPIRAPAQQSLAEHLGGRLSIVPHGSGEILFCCEGEQLDVDRVAALLVGQRRDCARMALRLHTRIDIAWMGQHVGA